MNGYLMIAVVVLFAALLAVLTAKLVSFCRRFTERTRYICHKMDHAENDDEYRKCRGNCVAVIFA